jgi:hypothetical protein
MNGRIKYRGLVLYGACALFGLTGCYGYGDLVDTCWPQRYNYMAGREFKTTFCPQVNNGKVLDQTIWNYHFETGTDRLTAGGLEHLAYIARRRPHSDTCLFLQTAQDISYDPSAPDKMAETRMDLDCKRIQAIQKFLTAQTNAQCSFQVAVHDPAEVGISAVAVLSSSTQMLTTRFKGGLTTSAGGAAPGGAAAAAPGR